jgi:hypothetical protein
MFLTFLQKRLKRVTLREYDTVARADNYFAEYRMLFLRHRGNERDIFEIALDGTSLFRGSCSLLQRLYSI